METNGGGSTHEAVLADLRAIAPKLVPRVRNFICSYVEHEFPQLGTGIAPGPEYLADDGRWSDKLEVIIKGFREAEGLDAREELATLLWHMNHLRHLPANGVS